MKIMITGPQGSGKTTQAEALAKYLGCGLINAGEEMRKISQEDSEKGRRVKECLEKGSLAPNEIVAEVVKDLSLKLEKLGGFITDGYPRALDQLELFDPNFDQVFYLDLPDNIAVQRLLRRSRIDDSPELIKQRLYWYHQTTEPLLEYFNKQGKLTWINGDQEIEQITALIIKNLKGNFNGQTSQS